MRVDEILTQIERANLQLAVIESEMRHPKSQEYCYLHGLSQGHCDIMSNRDHLISLLDAELKAAA